MPTKLLVRFNGDIGPKEYFIFSDITCIKKNVSGKPQVVTSMDELINYKGLLIITSKNEDIIGDTILDLNFVSMISFSI